MSLYKLICIAVFLGCYSCVESGGSKIVNSGAGRTSESIPVKPVYVTLNKGMNFLFMQSMIGDNWNYEGENWIALDSSGELYGGYRFLEDHENGIYKRYGRDIFTGSYTIVDDSHIVLKYTLKGKNHNYRCKYFITKDFLGNDQFEIQRVDDNDRLLKDPKNHFSGSIDPKDSPRVFRDRIVSQF